MRTRSSDLLMQYLICQAINHNVTRYEKIDHLQKLLNSRYRLTKSGYGEIVFFYQLFIPTGIGINNLSSIAVPIFSPLTPL